jgi:hypothetical protein
MWNATWFLCAKSASKKFRTSTKSIIFVIVAVQRSEQRKSAALEIAKNGLGKAKKVAVDAAIPVIIGVAAKVEKDMQKGTIDKGVKLVEEAAKVVLKKG